MSTEGKRLLMLGASMQQVPAIERAKEMGCYVITCDYLPKNPGHAIADESHNVSTIDLEGVLNLAHNKHIDGVVAYASDPAAPTAAFVAEKLGLPGNPYESVCVLTRKDQFRAFLADNGFNVPAAASVDSPDGAAAVAQEIGYPLMAKPVDSSGSKGVVKVESVDTLAAAVEEAFSYSRCGRVILERFIEKAGYQVSGDAFSTDGNLVFSSYGNELYSGNGTRDYVALGEFWPSLLDPVQKDAVDAEVQRIIRKLGMRTGPYNVEAIIDPSGAPYVLELGPRSGGSYIPQLIELATGVDLVEYVIRAALGESCDGLHMAPTTRCVSNYMVFSTQSGTFDHLEFDQDFERDNLLEVHCVAKPGDRIEAYRNTSHSLGTIIFQASSVGEMESLTVDMAQCYHVAVR